MLAAVLNTDSGTHCTTVVKHGDHYSIFLTALMIHLSKSRSQFTIFFLARKHMISAVAAEPARCPSLLFDGPSWTVMSLLKEVIAFPSFALSTQLRDPITYLTHLLSASLSPLASYYSRSSSITGMSSEIEMIEILAFVPPHADSERHRGR